MSRRLGTAAVVALLGALGSAAIARGATPPAPSAPDQPLRDGCQRNFTGVVFLKSPEWMYVYRDQRLRMASGVARVPHATLDDAPGEHAFHDFTANVVLDAQYRNLLGGSAAGQTGNFAPGAPDEAEARRRLHFEWELGTLPEFAWPADGDRATLWGSWIWDCGHWQDATGKITGERTEFHPLTAIVVNRRAPYLPRKPRSETDVFISSQGTGARAVQQCGLTLKPISATEFGPDFRSCVQTAANQRQPVARSYTFFVPAPPRPSRRARLVFSVLNRIGGGTGRQRVQRLRNGLRVTATPGAGAPAGATIRYGRSFLVGWTGARQPQPTRLKITLRKLIVVHHDPDLSADPSSGKWNLYLNVNGFEQLLNRWIPGLGAVTDGQQLTINRTVSVNVPAGRGLSLLVQGRECDIPSGKVVFGENVPIVQPCPVNTDEPAIALTNDDPGIVLDVFGSPRAALGNHTAPSVATTNRFPGSPPITFKDGKQGAGDYVLTYSVRRG
jgi:hypothetical protein